MFCFDKFRVIVDEHEDLLPAPGTFDPEITLITWHFPGNGDVAFGYNLSSDTDNHFRITFPNDGKSIELSTPTAIDFLQIASMLPQPLSVQRFLLIMCGK